MKPLRTVLMFSFATGLSVLALTAGAEVTFGGYLKTYAIAQRPLEALGDGEETFHSQNSVRLMWDGFHDRVAWQIHYELSPVFNSDGTVIDNRTVGRAGGTWRLTDVTNDLGDEDDKNRLLQNLDRFNVQITLPGADITLGRQPIAFGVARSVNPADVFLPFDVRVFSREYRVGVDAIRFQMPIGRLGEFDAGLILGDDARQETSAAYIQTVVNVRDNDLSFVAMQFAEQELIGLGLRRSLGPVGFWVEVSDVSGHQNYSRATTGIDYAFGENVYGQIEYHYNEAGSRDVRRYLSTVNEPAYEFGGVYLVGTRYVMPTLNVTLSARLTASAQAAFNLDDHSAFWGLSGELTITNNLYSDFGIYHYQGDELTLSRRRIPRVNSEFGTIPDLLWISLRYYF